MVPANYDWRFQLAVGHQIVQSQAEFCPFAIAQPADARRQSLKLYFFLRHLYPAFEVIVFREHFQNQAIGASNVRSLAGKRGPAERAFAFAKKRTNISWNKTREVVGVLQARFGSVVADIVSVVKSN